jgi:hypothetical protein
MSQWTVINMKINRVFTSLTVASLFLAGAVLPVSAVTISQWTFETSVPATAGDHLAEGGVAPGWARGSHAGATTYSNPLGNGSAESFSSTVWAVGDYYEFQVSTIGFADISLSWDQTSSATGPRDFRLSYSTDGSTFTPFSDYRVLLNGAPNLAWNSTTGDPDYSFSFDLNTVETIENVASVYFRLIDQSTTSASGGTVGSGGADRVDNFTVSGTAVTTAVPDSLPFGFTAATLLATVALAHRFSTRRCLS